MSVNRAYSFFVQWHLTERCNLACTHCYQDKARATEMTLEQIVGAMSDVVDMLDSWSGAYDMEFSRSFNITGGEPFLRKDLFAILEAAAYHGFDNYLLTNGTLIDREKARTLSDLGVRGVQVSFEGPREVHEAIRGKGTFPLSVAGVCHLRDAGIPVTMNVTLSSLNAPYLPELMNLASDLGVPRLGFSRLVPSGRGMGLLGSMLSRREVKTLYEEIFRRTREDVEVVTGDPVAAQMVVPPDTEGADAEGMETVPNGGCAAGVSGLTFLPDGTITPCRRLNIPLGNVRTDSLREIWATSPVLEGLRTKSAYKGKCGTCRRWSACRGCRAIAYQYSLSRGMGDYLSDDPQCFIE